MDRYINADKIDWRLILPQDVTLAGEHMWYRARKLIDKQPVADVVSREKYDELNDRYHRLLENAKIIADVVRDYERREDGSLH